MATNNVSSKFLEYFWFWMVGYFIGLGGWEPSSHLSWNLVSVNAVSQGSWHWNPLHAISSGDTSLLKEQIFCPISKVTQVNLHLKPEKNTQDASRSDQGCAGGNADGHWVTLASKCCSLWWYKLDRQSECPAFHAWERNDLVFTVFEVVRWRSRL